MPTGARGADESRGVGPGGGEGAAESVAAGAVDGVALAGVAAWAKPLAANDGVVDEVGIAGPQAAATTIVIHIATAMRAAVWFLAWARAPVVRAMETLPWRRQSEDCGRDIRRMRRAAARGPLGGFDRIGATWTGTGIISS